MEGRYRHYTINLTGSRTPCSSCTTAVVTYKPGKRGYADTPYEVEYLNAEYRSVEFGHYNEDGLHDAITHGILQREYPACLELPLGV